MKQLFIFIIGVGMGWAAVEFVRTILEDGWKVAVCTLLVIIFAAVIAFLTLMGLFYTFTVLAVMVLP